MKKVIFINNNELKIPYVVPKTERIQVEMEEGFLSASADARLNGSGTGITDWNKNDEYIDPGDNAWNGGD